MKSRVEQIWQMGGHFTQLVRFSHTIFALPFALGAALVAANGIPTPRVLCLILVCMITARNAAMAFNRLVDRKFDSANPRTAGRHLPAGLLSPNSVVLFILSNLLIFMLGTWYLNQLAFFLALPTLALLLSYSYCKRFTWLCHYWLGIVIGISPVGSWVAVRGELHLLPIWLGLLLALWISGFDIIYATQDKNSDSELGLKSIPVRWGIAGAMRLAALSHILLWTCMWLGYFYFALGSSWLVICLLCGALLAYIHGFRRSSDLDKLNRDFFLANAALSILVFMGLVLAVGQGRLNAI